MNYGLLHFVILCLHVYNTICICILQFVVEYNNCVCILQFISSRPGQVWWNRRGVWEKPAMFVQAACCDILCYYCKVTICQTRYFSYFLGDTKCVLFCHYTRGAVCTVDYANIITLKSNVMMYKKWSKIVILW